VYGINDPIWYPPFHVIYHYGKHLDPLPENQKYSKAFRKAEELLKGAVALLGIQLEAGELYWIQPVPDSEGSPDVRTGRYLPQGAGIVPNFEMQDVEVVSFLPEPSEDIASFLGRTKLSKEKAYDAQTTILCHIEKGIQVPSLLAITEALRGTGAACSVIVMGRTHPTRKDYVLLQVHPRFKEIVNYNVEEACAQRPRRSVLNLRRGSKPSNEYRPQEKHCPFESMGFDCPVIKDD